MSSFIPSIIQKSWVISKPSRFPTPIQHVLVLVPLPQKHRRHVPIAVNLFKRVDFPLPDVPPLPHRVGNDVPVAVVFVIHPHVREAGHFVEELLHRGEAAAAVPGGVGKLALVQIAKQRDAPNAGAQVVWPDGALAAVKGGLWKGPFGPGVEELERVVVEARGQRQTGWEAACAQQEERLGARDLVDVGHQYHVAEDGRRPAGQLREDLVVAGVALQVFIVPGPLGAERLGKGQLVVDHLVVEALEAIPVVEHNERLVASLERPGRLDNDEVVDVLVHGLEPNLQPVQLRVDHDEVVDLALARRRLRRKDVVAVSLAKGPRLARGVKVVVAGSVAGGEAEMRRQLLAQRQVEAGDAMPLGMMHGEQRLIRQPPDETEQPGKENEWNGP